MYIHTSRRKVLCCVEVVPPPRRLRLDIFGDVTFAFFVASGKQQLTMNGFDVASKEKPLVSEIADTRP